MLRMKPMTKPIFQPRFQPMFQPMPPPMTKPNPPRTRRWPGLLLAAITLLAALLLAACGPASPDAAAPDAAALAGLADLPAGLGRGYPLAAVEGEPQPGGLLQAGEPAPDFTMRLEDGRSLRLSDLRGGPVVINFWATWCGPCRLEMPELVKAAQEDERLALLAVDVQEARAPVEQFAAEFAMHLPIVLDSEGKLRNLYRVPGLPTTYFVDADGAIASVVIGPLTPQALAERLAEIR
jgi:thiol-disulfide isomerase/thioredoxin